MAEVPIQISGILYDLYGRTTQRVVLTGDASIQGLTVGGGPIVPPEDVPPKPPLGIWGGGNVPMPTPPIHLGPGGEPRPPTMWPPVIWGGPIIPPEPPPVVDNTLPPVPPDPPQTPPGTRPPEGWSWCFVGSEWLLIYNPPGGGKPSPVPPPNTQLPA